MIKKGYNFPDLPFLVKILYLFKYYGKTNL